jgi:hypothetical protein
MAAEALGVLGQLAAEQVEALRQAHRVLHRHVAGRREPHALRGALQQHRTRRLLEVRQAPARRRQGEVAARGPLGDAAGLRDGAEQAPRVTEVDAAEDGFIPRSLERRVRWPIRACEGRIAGKPIPQKAPGLLESGHRINRARHMQALNGLKVLELGQLYRRPVRRHRRWPEFGADVIKVERKGGRRSAAQGGACCATARRCGWQVQSRKQRSVSSGPATPPRARRRCARWRAEADVLIENFKPGTLEGWGLGWAALHAANPRLIMLRISGYGQTGPYRDKPGFGVLGEAMGGLRHLTGEPGRCRCAWASPSATPWPRCTA